MFQLVLLNKTLNVLVIKKLSYLKNEFYSNLRGASIDIPVL